LITGQPVEGEKNKKFWVPKIYLATPSRKPFVDIWYGLRKKMTELGLVELKKKLPYFFWAQKFSTSKGIIKKYL
jgi:hypothetical protein